MMDVKSLISMAISKNPEMKNDANALAMIDAVLNNDEKTGIEIANSILNANNISRNDGINMAKQRFGIR